MLVQICDLNHQNLPLILPDYPSNDARSIGDLRPPTNGYGFKPVMPDQIWDLHHQNLHLLLICNGGAVSIGDLLPPIDSSQPAIPDQCDSAELASDTIHLMMREVLVTYNHQYMV